MRFTPLLASAAALGPVLGVAVGGSINTIPKRTGGDVLAMLDSIPRHEDLQFSSPSQQSSLLPDHYPLVTPRGTIQVAELWQHGLYRNRRPAQFDYDFGPEIYEFEVPAAETPAEPNVSLAKEPVLPGTETGVDAPLGQPTAARAATARDNSNTPGPLPIPAEVPPLQSGPKVIDVAAVLARK